MKAPRLALAGNFFDDPKLNVFLSSQKPEFISVRMASGHRASVEKRVFIFKYLILSMTDFSFYLL